MGVLVRRLQPGEEREFVRSMWIPFLHPVTGDEEGSAEVERASRATEVERSWVADTGDGFVGNCGIYTLDVTVPAAPGTPCPVVAMGAITGVGVHPTHRRQGLLTQMMDKMLADCRARGEPVAGLLASEAGIYGRFGFGLSTEAAEYSIDTREAAMLEEPAPADLRLVRCEEAASILPRLFDRQRRVRAGEPGRRPVAWEEYLADEPARRHGANPAFVAVCGEGYVVYRAVRERPGVAGRQSIVVEELRGVTPEVEAGIWRYLLDIDLVDQVTARCRPVDEALKWRLEDPRQLRMTRLDDRLHLRVLDVAAALEARGYRGAGRLVIEVTPPAVDGGPPDGATGRWVLEAGPDGSSCRRARTGEAPDLRMELSILGALYMGAFRVSALAGAGRVEELTPGSLLAADRMLPTSPAPLTGTGF